MRRPLATPLILLGLTLAGVVAPLAPATADDQLIAAAYPNTYTPSTIHLKQGEALTFANFDTTSGGGHTLIHAVPEGQRRFESRVVAVGSSAKVPNIEKLPPGTYPFACRIHAIMQGTLVVQ